MEREDECLLVALVSNRHGSFFSPDTSYTMTVRYHMFANGVFVESEADLSEFVVQNILDALAGDLSGFDRTATYPWIENTEELSEEEEEGEVVVVVKEVELVPLRTIPATDLFPDPGTPAFWEAISGSDLFEAFVWSALYRL